MCFHNSNGEIPFHSSVLITVEALAIGGIQGAIVWASVGIDWLCCSKTDAFTMFSSSAFHHPSMSTTPVK